MKIRINFAVILGFASIVGAVGGTVKAQDDYRPPNTPKVVAGIKEAIQSFYNDETKGMNQKDPKEAQQHVSKSFQEIEPSGKKLTSDQRLGGVIPMLAKAKSVSATQTAVSIYMPMGANNAEIIAKHRIVMTTSTGRHVVITSRTKDLWVPSYVGWQLTTSTVLK